jgi:hypothetical protein
MTNRHFWKRFSLFLAGCALFGCWAAQCNSTKDVDHETAVAGSTTRPGRMPLEPTDSEQFHEAGESWNSRVYPDHPTSREELWRRLSSRRSSSQATTVESDDDMVVRVIVGYRNANGLSKLLRHKILKPMPSVTADTLPPSGLSRIHALASTFRFGDLHSLVVDADVAYIEWDSNVNGAENRPPQQKRDAIPVSMYEVQNGPKSAIRRQYYNNGAEQPRAESTSPTGSESTGPCLNDKALRVAIVDSGVDLEHPDLPCNLPQTCIGRDFTGSGTWDVPDNDHGTCAHATGIQALSSRLKRVDHSSWVALDRDSCHGNARRPSQRYRRPGDGPRPCLRLLDRCQGPGQGQPGPHVSGT